MKRYCFTFLLFIVLMNSSTSTQAQKLSFSEIQNTIRKDDLKQAVSLLKEYINQNPDSINTYVILGKVYLGIGGFNNRTEAEKTFQEGLSHDPRNVILLQLLASLKKQQNMPELSNKWLEMAFKSDPTNPKIMGQLLDYYIQKGNKEKIESMRSFIVTALQKDSTNASLYLALGKLETSLNHADKATPLLTKGSELNPENHELHRALCEAFLKNGQGALFTEEYFKWLEKERDPIVLSQEYVISELIMSDEEVIQFKNTPVFEKNKFLIKYWREHDPYPITVQNERLIEHWQRFLYVRAAFHTIQGNLGFDDRGKVFIRWGPPEERYVDSMPADTSGIVIRENESWYYPSLNLNLAFDFVDYGGYYQEVPSLIDAISGGYKTGSIEEKADAARDLYERRSHLGGIYSRLGHDLNPWAALKEYHSDKLSAKQNIKPPYEMKLDIPKLEFVYRISQFRGDSGRTEIDFAYGVPLKQYQSKPTGAYGDTPSKRFKKDSSTTFTFQTDFVLFDSTSMRNLQTKNHQKFVCPPNLDYTKVSFLNEVNNTVFPGHYKMAFQIIEGLNKRGDFKVRSFQVRDFTGINLLLSDLKLSLNIKSMGIDAKTGLERLEIMPYPSNHVTRKQAIFVYFEIYNLSLTPDQKTNYEISLKMEREVKKGEYAVELLHSIGRIFTGGKPQEIETLSQREGSQRTAIEYIALDLSKLSIGNSRLTVTVKDLNMNKQVANSIEFDLQ